MAAATNKRSRPAVDAMDGVRFKTVRIEHGTISVSGGFSKRRKEHLPLTTESFHIPGETRVTEFFHAAETEPWFAKLVSGQQFMGSGHKHWEVFDLIRSNLEEHFEGTAQTDRSAASPGNAAASSSTDTTPPKSAAVDDGPVLAPAVTDDTSVFDALSALAASSDALSAILAPGPNAKPKAKARPCIPLDTPVWLKLPNVPGCVSAFTPGRDELVHVCAMLRGPAGRDIWLDMGSLHWVIAFAADELSECGRNLTPHPANLRLGKPNCPGLSGLWKWYDRNLQWIIFGFVEEVPGLAAKELKRRRYLPIASLTENVWDKYVPQAPFNQATTKDKRGLAELLIGLWSRAILAGTEQQFLDEHDLVPGPLPTATSAQAAFVPAASNTLANDALAGAEQPIRFKLGPAVTVHTLPTRQNPTDSSRTSTSDAFPDYEVQ